MTDMEILSKIINGAARVPMGTDDNGKHYFVELTEQIRQSEKEYRVKIRNLPYDALIIDLDRNFAVDRIFSGEKGECCRADYIIISEEKECIVYIEMKSTTDKPGHIANQLKGAHCFMEYCREIAKTFWDQNLRHDYKHRFIAIKHCGSIGKTPIKDIPKVKERGNPEKPAIFAYAPEIQFPVLV